MFALPIIVVVAVVVAYEAWRRRRGVLGLSPSSGGGGRSAIAPNLQVKLGEWVDAGVIDAQQATAIETHETALAKPDPTRIPLASEAIGYLGGALVLAAVMVQSGQRWHELGSSARLLVIGIPTVFVGALGWPIGRRPDEAFQRLGSVLWLLAGAGVAGLAAEVFVDVIHDGDPPDHGGALFVGGITTVPALAAWWLRREPLQQLGLYATVVATVVGAIDAFGEFDSDGWTVASGLALFALGTAWLALGAVERMTPAIVAMVIGGLTILFSPQIVLAGNEHAGLWLGLASTAALVAYGAARSRVEVLLVGTAGLFQWVPQVALRYLGDRLGTTATLLVIGVLLLALAGSLNRLVPRLSRRHRLGQVIPSS